MKAHERRVLEKLLTIAQVHYPAYNTDPVILEANDMLLTDDENRRVYAMRRAREARKACR